MAEPGAAAAQMRDESLLGYLIQPLLDHVDHKRCPSGLPTPVRRRERQGSHSYTKPHPRQARPCARRPAPCAPDRHSWPPARASPPSLASRSKPMKAQPGRLSAIACASRVLPLNSGPTMKLSGRMSVSSKRSPPHGQGRFKATDRLGGGLRQPPQVIRRPAPGRALDRRASGGPSRSCP